MANLLSMQGRVSRGQYAINTILIPFVLSIVIALVASLEITVLTIAAWSALAFMEVVIAFHVVKRLHDIGRPGSHFWLLLVPLYNVYLTLLLLFKKGTAGANAFGPDPLEPESTLGAIPATGRHSTV